MSEEEWKVVNCMKKYGGSFVQQLAKLYQVADFENRHKIRTSFFGYWITYEKMANENAAKTSVESEVRNRW